MSNLGARMQNSEYQPWHLEFRPQTLLEVSGHELLKRTLINSIKLGRIANGYLFCGGKGTGKTSTARIFAKSLNCLAFPKPTVEPCGKCSNCKEIEQASNLDVIEIDAASNNGVEHIRSVIETAQLTAVNSRYRIFVLDECHMLTRAAANSLLKTLEEASFKRVVFILCTTEKDKVIDTIASRCLNFDFIPIPQSEIIERLQFICNQENVEASNSALKAIAKHSQGGMRDAIQNLEELALSADRTPIESYMVLQKTGKMQNEDLMKIMDSVFSGDLRGINTLLLKSHQLITQGKQPKEILEQMLEVYRDLAQLVILIDNGEKVDPESISLLSDLNLEYLTKTAASTSWRQLELGFNAIERAFKEVSLSSNSRIWLDMLLLRLAKLGLF